MADAIQLMRGSLGRPALMLDAWDYAARVFERREAPWVDTPRLVSLARRTVGLLRPDIIAFPMLEWFGAQLYASSELREVAGKRTRTTYALKTALSDAALQQAFVEVVSALTSALPNVPVVPSVAAPASWLRLAYRAAHDGEPNDIDDDMCEQAEVFLAGFLSSIAAAPIGALLIDEPEVEVNAAWVGMHTPVFNAGAHYRWRIGVTFSRGVEDLPSLVAWTIGAAARSSLPCGKPIDVGFWSADGVPPSAADFYSARVPPQSHPETVLLRLESLREPKM